MAITKNETNSAVQWGVTASTSNSTASTIITQAAGPCTPTAVTYTYYITVSPTSTSLPCTGGTVSFDVNSYRIANETGVREDCNFTWTNGSGKGSQTVTATIGDSTGYNYGDTIVSGNTEYTFTNTDGNKTTKATVSQPPAYTLYITQANSLGMDDNTTAPGETVSYGITNSMCINGTNTLSVNNAETEYCSVSCTNTSITVTRDSAKGNISHAVLNSTYGPGIVIIFEETA